MDVLLEFYTAIKNERIFALPGKHLVSLLLLLLFFRALLNWAPGYPASLLFIMDSH